MSAVVSPAGFLVGEIGRDYATYSGASRWSAVVGVITMLRPTDDNLGVADDMLRAKRGKSNGRAIQLNLLKNKIGSSCWFRLWEF